MDQGLLKASGSSDARMLDCEFTVMEGPHAKRKFWQMFTVQGGRGTLKIGTDYLAELEPYVSAAGKTTTLTDTVFSTVPGAPVFVGKAPVYRSKNAKLGINIDIKNHNALQSTFVFQS